MLVTLIDGLSIGAIYALVALGYTMVYGIARMINFAHGEVIMVGAYSVYTTLILMPLASARIFALVISIIVCTALGIFIERVAYRPLRSASPLAILISAIGVSYFLSGIAQLLFGAASRPVDLSVEGSVFGINYSAIITLTVATVLMVALTLFVKLTKTGRAMVAVSEDAIAAQLMGINVNKIVSVTFAIGSALAAAAGVFYLMQIPATSPTLGAMPGIKAFSAAVIGGIGSIPGAMLGGVLLGIIEKLSLSSPTLAPYTTSVEFGLLILILLLRPAGILGKVRTEKV